MAKLMAKGATAAGKRWVVRYREPGGRTARQREKSFERKRDALDFATKVENDKHENTYVDPTAGRVSVSQYAEGWLASKVGAPGTLVGYERIMRLHVLPHVGNKPMAKVTAADVEALFPDGVRRDPFVACGVREEARERGPTASDGVGLRAVLAPASDIPAPALLDAFHEFLPVRNARGGMTHPGLVRKSWDAAIARLGLPPYKPHDLRHKWATITMSNGAALREGSRWLGHRSVDVTADLHGHLTQDGRERCRLIIMSSFAQHVPAQPASPATPGAESVRVAPAGRFAHSVASDSRGKSATLRLAVADSNRKDLVQIRSLRRDRSARYSRVHVRGSPK
ncbi:hypothetical protein ABT381_05595 [Streptomyces sp. NPDC000151]|uniref:hypothetical protein n=1 Tax=Streptomyces sp. NPDC000151 TaxID=3154244 RepID=UPI0033343E70